jgi:zinc transporter ZupT
MNTYLITLLFGALASLNVFLGSFLTVRLEKHFNTILGLAGGVMIGTVAFEVIPEIVELLHAHETFWTSKASSIFFILGIVLFHFLSKILPLHEHGHHDHGHHSHIKTSSKLGLYGAMVMIAHSFIDGLGIGIGFSSSVALGISISLAVLIHNLSDGINTTSTLLSNNMSSKSFKRMVALSISAPFLGVLTSFFIEIPETWLLYYLSFFTGSILYLAISDILPYAHSHSDNKKPILATLMGLIAVFILSLFLTHAH